MLDNLLLTLYLAAAGVLSIAYYQWLLPAAELKRRLPNRVSPASLVLAAALVVIIILVLRQDSGWLRFRQFLPIIFNLLLFEAFLVLLVRWIKNTLPAVLICGLAALGTWWLQQEFQTVAVYNATFILAPLGAAGLLIRMNYWRTKILWLMAGLWTIYDVLAANVIYPVIFKPAAAPIPSFLYPAVIAGQRTLGSGDFMFLTIFTLALVREFGARIGYVHIIVQALALLITVSVKPAEVQFPYLTVMTPLFFLVWWWARTRTPKPQLAQTPTPAKI